MPPTGPLAGIKVVELAGIGPAPFCCMLLADMGAEIIRVDRTAATDLGVPTDPRLQITHRGRRSIAVDLKSPEGVGIVKSMLADADVLVEGHRPGVTERMGLGPADCMAINPRLVYGRMTGWGQDGPLAQAAGHDINYIALTGVLDAIGPRGGDPTPPLNLIGDFGGGALYLAFGIACALLEVRSSGKGQVVDGAANLMAGIFTNIARGDWSRQRGDNMVGGGRPWYGVYRTLDDQYISIGAVENRFYAELLEKIGLNEAELPPRGDAAGWDALSEKLRAVFRTRTRQQWTELLDGGDACFAPVLSVDEAPDHPHIKARKLFVEAHGMMQPAPAPRFSRSEPSIRRPPPARGQHTREVLKEMGYEAARINALFAKGAVV